MAARRKYERELLLRLDAALQRSLKNPRPTLTSAFDDDEVDFLMGELAVSRTYRYINRPLKNNVDRIDIIERLEGFSDRQCKAILRMSRASFIKLVDLIFDHAVFKSKGYREQEEVAAQLAVTLDRLGHNGNGMELTRLATFWDRSERSCQNYTDRVLEALMSLENQLTTWPTPEQRLAHSEKMEKMGFPGCVGFIDGTTVPFSQHPAYQGDSYYDRHGRYSLNVQVVCDADRRIIQLFAGYSGQCHNHYVFRNSDLWDRQGEYFAEGQYLIANSTFPASAITVPSFKGRNLSEDQTDFNSCVAHVLVANEHCIGMLKQKWRSLTELPLTIHSEETVVRDTTKALNWICACAVLHNFLIAQNEVPDLEACREVFQARESFEQVPASRNSAAGNELRENVMRFATEVGRRPGGIVSYRR